MIPTSPQHVPPRAHALTSPRGHRAQHQSPASPRTATAQGGSHYHQQHHPYATADPLAAQREHLLEQVRRREVGIIRAIVRGEVSPTDVKPSVLLTARGVRDSEVAAELRSPAQTGLRSGGSTPGSAPLTPQQPPHSASFGGFSGTAARDTSGPKMVAPLRPRPPPTTATAAPSSFGNGSHSRRSEADDGGGLFVRKGADRTAVLFGHASSTPPRGSGGGGSRGGSPATTALSPPPPSSLYGSHHFSASPPSHGGHGAHLQTPADARLAFSFLRLDTLPVPKPNAPPIDVALTWEDVWPRGASLFDPARAAAANAHNNHTGASLGGGGVAGGRGARGASPKKEKSTKKKKKGSSPSDAALNVNFDILSADPSASPLLVRDRKGKPAANVNSGVNGTPMKAGTAEKAEPPEVSAHESLRQSSGTAAFSGPAEALASGHYADAAHSSFADTLPVLMQRWREGARRLAHPPTIFLPAYSPDELNLRVQTTAAINNTVFGVGQGAYSGGPFASPAAPSNHGHPHGSGHGQQQVSAFGLGGLALSNAAALQEPEFAKVRQICEAVDRVMLHGRTGRPKPPPPPPPPRTPTTPTGGRAGGRTRSAGSPNSGAAANGNDSSTAPQSARPISPSTAMSAELRAQFALDASVDAVVAPVRAHLRDLQCLAFALHDVAAVAFFKSNAVGAAVMLAADQLRASVHRLFKAWRDEEGPVVEAKLIASRVRLDVQHAQQEAAALRREVGALEQRVAEQQQEIARLNERLAAGGGGGGGGGTSALGIGAASQYGSTAASALGHGRTPSPPAHQHRQQQPPQQSAIGFAAAALLEAQQRAAYGKSVADRAQRQRDEAAWTVVDEEAAAEQSAKVPKFGLSARRMEARLAEMGRARRRPVVTIDTGTSCEDLFFTAFGHKAADLAPTVPVPVGGAAAGSSPNSPTHAGTSEGSTFLTGGTPAPADALSSSAAVVTSQEALLARSSSSLTASFGQPVAPQAQRLGAYGAHASAGRQLHRTSSGRHVSPYASAEYSLFSPRDDLSYVLSAESILGPARARMARLGSRLVAQASVALGANSDTTTDATAAPSPSSITAGSAGPQLRIGTTGSGGGPDVASEGAGATASGISLAPRFAPSDILRGVIGALEAITGRRLTASRVYALVQRPDLDENCGRETQTTPSLHGPTEGRGARARGAAAVGALQTRSAAPQQQASGSAPQSSKGSKQQATKSGGKMGSSSTAPAPQAATLVTVPDSPTLSVTAPPSTSATPRAGAFDIPNTGGASHAKALLQQIPSMISVTNAFKSAGGARRARAAGRAAGLSGAGLGGPAVATREMATMADRYTITFPQILKVAPLSLEHLLTGLVPSFEAAVADGVASVVLRGSSGCEDPSSPFFFFVSQDNLRAAVLETLLFVSVDQIMAYAAEDLQTGGRSPLTPRGGEEDVGATPLTALENGSTPAATEGFTPLTTANSAASFSSPPTASFAPPAPPPLPSLGLGRLLYEAFVLSTHLKHGGNDAATLAWLDAAGVACFRHLTRTYAQRRLRAEEDGLAEGDDDGDADDTSEGGGDSDDDESDSGGSSKRSPTRVRVFGGGRSPNRSGGNSPTAKAASARESSSAIFTPSDPEGHQSKKADSRQKKKKKAPPSPLRAALRSLGGLQSSIGRLWDMEHVAVVHGNERVVEARQTSRKAQLRVELARAALSSGGSIAAVARGGTSIASSIPAATNAGGGGVATWAHVPSTAGGIGGGVGGLRQSVAATTARSVSFGNAGGEGPAHGGGGGGGASAAGLRLLTASALLSVNGGGSRAASGVAGSIASADHEARHLSELSAGAMFPMERVSSQFVTALFLRWAAGGFLGRAEANGSSAGVDFLPEAARCTPTALAAFVSMLHATIALLDGPRVEALFRGSLFLTSSEALVLLATVVPLHVVEAAGYYPSEGEAEAGLPPSSAGGRRSKASSSAANYNRSDVTAAGDERSPDALLRALLATLLDAPLPPAFVAMNHVPAGLHWDTLAARIVLGWVPIIEPIYAKASAVLMTPVLSLRPWRAAPSDFFDAADAPTTGGAANSAPNVCCRCGGGGGAGGSVSVADTSSTVSAANARQAAAAALSRAATPLVPAAASSAQAAATADVDEDCPPPQPLPLASATTDGIAEASGEATSSDELPTLSVTIA